MSFLLEGISVLGEGTREKLDCNTERSARTEKGGAGPHEPHTHMLIDRAFLTDQIKKYDCFAI